MKAACALAAFALLGIDCAQAQGWSPQKNVELVVPVAPGGTLDKLARGIERTFVAAKVLNTSFTLVHRPGGGNQIGYNYVTQHAGDPHYLLIGTSTLITAHATGSSKLGYADFTPIASIFNDFVVLTVNAGSPLKSGQDLIAKMKTNAQSLPLGFASSAGNHHHIIAGLFMKGIGASPRELKTVIFKGSAAALTALLGGHIELVSTGAGNAAPHMEAGKLRILGVSSGQRMPGAMAGVPTWKEQGLDLVYGSWRTILAPKGVTREQVAFWEGALRKVVESADWKAELERNYWGDFFQTGPELQATIDREYKAMKAVLIDLGLAKS
ncbi:MAG: tripartite tricarboxylate transporter substrate binding protein [Burkholderiales bacterium]